MNRVLGTLTALALLLVGAEQSQAGILGQPVNDPTNEGPPAGPIILNLDGQANPHAYTLYTASFTAASASTNLSFAFREDPAFLFLSNVSMVDTTTSSANLLVNGDFNAGPVGASAPSGWTYLNTFGASFGGYVQAGTGVGGNNSYYDGAVQAYDAITQNVATTTGDSYTVSFYLYDDSGLSNFSAFSTNGDNSDTGGNGANLVVYAGAQPTASPEPASLTLLGIGIAGLAGYRWRQRRKVAAA